MNVRIERFFGQQWQIPPWREATPLFARLQVIQKRRGASFPAALHKRAFTLIELILIMALLIIAISFVTPRLAGFFRGRTLNSEARQVIALMHDGQSRAVSRGVPMILWFDAKNQTYGLEEEPGYTEKDKDPDAVEFTLDSNLQIEIPENDSSQALATAMTSEGPRPGLPKISFLPDGTIAETSPQTVRIVDHDGPALSLTQTRDRNQYEIATTKE